MTRLYAIGDVHGCIDALNELLIKIQKDAKGEKHKIIFLGDYVDRGPDSKAVIEKLMDLEQQNGPHLEYIFLRGNHEDLFFRGDHNWIYNGGGTTINSYSKDDVIYEGIMNNHRSWLQEHTKFYHTEDKYLFVHAGMNPHVKHMETVTDEEYMWSRAWTSYDGIFSCGYFVIHGHTPVEVPHKLTAQLNIDTGCAYGKAHPQYGKLTAVCIHDSNEIIKNIDLDYHFLTTRQYPKEE